VFVQMQACAKAFGIGRSLRRPTDAEDVGWWWLTVSQDLILGYCRSSLREERDQSHRGEVRMRPPDRNVGEDARMTAGRESGATSGVAEVGHPVVRAS
jgi:hypothetical protein